MRKLVVLIVHFFVFSCVLAANASAEPASAAAQPELGKWWKKSEIVNRLQLSDAQINKIEQTFLNHRPALANFSEELQKRESELRMLMQADPVDESKVLTQNELVVQSRTALEKVNTSMLLAIRKDLTKEQWDKLQEIQALRRVSGFFAPSSVPTPRGSFPNIMQTRPGEKVYHAGVDPIEPPKCLYQPLPKYTDEAKAARVEGFIIMQGIIRKNGHIDSLIVLRGLGYGLDESALQTVATEWRFEPGTLNGQPVDVQANIEVSFRLY